MADLPKTPEQPKVGLFSKAIMAIDATLDSYITRSKGDSIVKAQESRSNSPAMDQKAFMEVDHLVAMQYGYQEKQGLISFDVLKQMSRKDSVVASIIQTRMSQVSNFGFPQKDKYSPGFIIVPREPADIPKLDKVDLADPTLTDDEADEKRYELERKKMEERIKQEEEMKEVQAFLVNCGRKEEDVLNDPSMESLDKMDFDTFLKLIIKDRLTYNYTAIELVPTKDGRLHHFIPVSAGSIRRVTRKSAEQYNEMLRTIMVQEAEIEGKNVNYDNFKKNFKYVQLIRGKVVAGWTDEELVFEAGNPSVDPEDRGYAPGELEILIQIVTSHLFAEAHNRNFFTQGIGSKGILHIKGENTSRSQLEGFKRQWYSQMVNSRNAFRPPIISAPDDIKWVPLTQSNREMEFQSWMEYLIKLCTAVYQMDPAEINFDINKTSTSTLNEANNEERLKSSKDKGLRPLLTYVEKIVNTRLLPAWNPDLAAKYEFKFAGLDNESRMQEVDRLDKETHIWKTINEARTEMGYEPISEGDVIRDATYTQYLQMKTQQQQGAIDGQMGIGAEDAGIGGSVDDLAGEIEATLDEGDAKDKEAAKNEKAAQKEEDTKKSIVQIEYHHFQDK